MRRIGTLSEQSAAQKFHAFLERQGIENRIDGLFDTQTERFSYEVWVANEDRLQEAANAFAHFEGHPHDTRYTIPVQEILEGEKAEPQRIRAPVTSFFLFLCVLIFGISYLQELPLRQEGLGPESILFTPIESACLIDLPPPIEELEKWFQEPHTGNVEQEAIAKMKSLEGASWWQGVYEWDLLKAKTGSGDQALGPLFIKVRQGEIWRLFTPALLHGGLLHILFNMIWLYVLGRPVEQRIGSFKILGMSLFLGVASNVCQ